MKKFLSVLLTVVMIATLCIGSSVTALAASNDCPENPNMDYGPWYGYSETSWSTSVQGWSSFTQDVSERIMLYVPSKVAKSIALGLYAGADLIIMSGFEVEYTYGTIEKEYREVFYSDGTFAYFQTRYDVYATVVSTDGTEEDLPVESGCFQGSSPMRASDYLNR